MRFTKKKYKSNGGEIWPEFAHYLVEAVATVIFVGSADAGILIDIGRSAKQIQEMLSACDIPIGAIKAIFLTHEHTDHIKGTPCIYF